VESNNKREVARNAARAAHQSLGAAGAGALRPQLHRAAAKGLPSVTRVALKAAEDQKLVLCTALMREVGGLFGRGGELVAVAVPQWRMACRASSVARCCVAFKHAWHAGSTRSCTVLLLQLAPAACKQHANPMLLPRPSSQGTRHTHAKPHPSKPGPCKHHPCKPQVAQVFGYRLHVSADGAPLPPSTAAAGAHADADGDGQLLASVPLQQLHASLVDADADDDDDEGYEEVLEDEDDHREGGGLVRRALSGRPSVLRRVATGRVTRRTVRCWVGLGCLMGCVLGLCAFGAGLGNANTMQRQDERGGFKLTDLHTNRGSSARAQACCWARWRARA